MIFELANFHPFHFAAQVNDNGTVVDGDNPEIVETVLVPYLPGSDVTVSFDVTSFQSTITGDNGEVLPFEEQVSVDPFGTAFDIYIDAPMLEIDTNDPYYTSGKIEADPDIEGRFIYHVDADRDAEANGGDPLVYDEINTSRSGERKFINFKTKNIVSTGDIKISSDESMVVFFDKTFKIQNESITGTLRYKDGDSVYDIPASSFIPFEVLPTYNRIGTVNVNDSGEFELRLRSEYRYNWNVDDVKFQFTTDGKIYEKSFDSLADLYEHLENDGTIVLE